MVKKIILVHTFCDIFLQSGILFHGFTGVSACNDLKKKSLFPKPGLTLAPNLTLYRTKKTKQKQTLYI